MFSLVEILVLQIFEKNFILSIVSKSELNLNQQVANLGTNTLNSNVPFLRGANTVCNGKYNLLKGLESVELMYIFLNKTSST